MAKTKKRKMEEEVGPNIGIVMTVSLFLILLTFFILLNSIAVLDDHRSRKAIGSLIGAFGGLPGGLSPMASGESVLPPTAPLINETLTMDLLLSYMQSGVTNADVIRVVPTTNGEIITLNEEILFAKDRTNLKATILPFLNKLCNIINTGDFPIEIIGHTDDSPAQVKGYRSNWELTALMAIQLLKYFVSEGSVHPHRITAYGSSSYQPITSNETRQSRAQNRRVDIILKYNAPPYIKKILSRKPSGSFTYKKFDFKIF